MSRQDPKRAGRRVRIRPLPMANDVPTSSAGRRLWDSPGARGPWRHRPTRRSSAPTIDGPIRSTGCKDREHGRLKKPPGSSPASRHAWQHFQGCQKPSEVVKESDPSAAGPQLIKDDEPQSRHRSGGAADEFEYGLCTHEPYRWSQVKGHLLGAFSVSLGFDSPSRCNYQGRWDFRKASAGSGCPAVNPRASRGRP